MSAPVYPNGYAYPVNGAPPQGGYMPPQGDYAMQQGYPQGYATPVQAYAAPPGAVPVQAYANPTAVSPYGGMPPTQQGYNPGEAPPGYGAYPPQQQPPPGYAYPPNATMGGYPPVDPMKAAGAPPPGYGQPYGHAVVAIPVATPQENPHNTIEKGRWSAGICDCCASCVPNFCMTWCCPCVSLAQIQARIGMTTYRTALTRLFSLTLVALVIRFVFNRMAGSNSSGSWVTTVDSNGYSSYEYVANPSNLILGSVGYVAWMVMELIFAACVCSTRQRVRHRFNIPGGCCEDTFCSCCCTCCAIAQMATHVKSYKPGSCDFGGPDVLPAFN